jgi:hypothetical protein
MSNRWIVPTVVVLAGLAAASAVIGARQQPVNPPGLPTPARIEVTNRGPAEALPVLVQAGGEIQPVAVMSAPVLSLAPNTVVATEARPQRWEYRVISSKGVDDLVSALDRAGADGWEAVGVVPAPAGVTQVLVKRPR